MVYFFIRSINSEIKMNKFNRKNGFSQVLILVIISFLAIALPITTKLVQKSQENRSSAAAGCSSYTSANKCNLTSDGKCTWSGGKCVSKSSTPSCSVSNCSLCDKSYCDSYANSCFWDTSNNICKTRTDNDNDCKNYDTKNGEYYCSTTGPRLCTDGILGDAIPCNEEGRQGCDKNGCAATPPVWTAQDCKNYDTRNGEYYCSTTGPRLCTNGILGYAMRCLEGENCDKKTGCSAAKTEVTATNHCGTANGITVSSVPTGASACVAGFTRNVTDYTAEDGTYNWKCIDEQIVSECSAKKSSTASLSTWYYYNGSSCVSAQFSSNADCISVTLALGCFSKLEACTAKYICDSNVVSGCYNSNYLRKCNSTGTAWEQGDKCPDGQTCQSGVCKTYDPGYTPPTPTPTGVGTTIVGGMKLSFKIAFMGVKPNPSCLDNFKTVAITVGKVGTTLSQDLSVPVAATSETNSSGYGIFKAENIVLGTGFSGVSNIYVKIKGSVHSRMYYCTNNQSAKNTSQTCNIATDGTMNNFYDYPILAGDVDQNGIVNVLDFGLIRNSVFVSGCSKGDLNGDSVVNDFDIKLYKVALEAKYDE